MWILLGERGEDELKYMKSLDTMEAVCPHHCPCPGAIDMHIHCFIYISKNHMVNQSRTPCGEGAKVYINDPGHMAKLATKPIHVYGKGKTRLKSSPEVPIF